MHVEERLCTKTWIEREGQDNSEMAYCPWNYRVVLLEAIPGTVLLWKHLDTGTEKSLSISQQCSCSIYTCTCTM